MSTLAKLAARGDDGPPAEVIRAALQSDTPPAQRGDGIVSRCIASIEAKPINWLWDGRIARGKLTVIAGNPGLGKSQLTAWLAAIISTGGYLPLGALRCARGSVIFLSAEDDPADTLRPRLEAVGADLTRVHIIDAVSVGYRADGTPGQRGFSLQVDIEALGRLIETLGDVVAVVIDPISAYMGGADSHKNAEVRALLAPLSELAARYGVAVIVVSHMSKAQGQQALLRVIGSVGLVGAARAAFLVAADPEDKARRLFLPLKNNIGSDETGLAFRIEGATVPSGAGPIQTSRIVWESEAVTMTADDAMQSAGRETITPRESATQFLRDLLADGPVHATEVDSAAEDAGHSGRTIRRAAEALGVLKRKVSTRGPWTWALPSKAAKSAEDGQLSHVDTLATLDEVGHLGRSVDVPKVATEAEGGHTNNVDIFEEVGHLRGGDDVVEVEL